MVKRKAIRNIITGRVEAYENSETFGIRDIFTGKIVKRVKKVKSII